MARNGRKLDGKEQTEKRRRNGKATEEKRKGTRGNGRQGA